MSGGILIINCFRISEFSEALEREIIKQEAINALINALINAGESIAREDYHKEAEWLFSGDTSDEPIRRGLQQYSFRAEGVNYAIYNDL